jgi:hypothetical protein
MKIVLILALALVGCGEPRDITEAKKLMAENKCSNAGAAVDYVVRFSYRVHDIWQCPGGTLWILPQ